MESTVSIEQFREELQSWKHELSSTKEEIRHFENQLEKMASRPLPKELMGQIEHFQNSFICQKEVIDRLRHDLPDSGQKVERIFNSFHTVYPKNPHPGQINEPGRPHQHNEPHQPCQSDLPDQPQQFDQPDQHALLEERMQTLRKLYNEIRQDFKRLIAAQA